MGQQSTMGMYGAGRSGAGTMTVSPDALAWAGQRLDTTADQAVRMPGLLRLPHRSQSGPRIAAEALSDLEQRLEAAAVLMAGAMAAAASALHASAASYSGTEAAVGASCGTWTR